MRYTARTQLLGLVVLMVLIGAEPHAPTVVIRDANEAQLEQVAWALGRFEEAGLQLPPIELTFHDGAGPCEGHPGLYRPGDVARIEICSSRNHVILHELAHAWEGASVTTEVRNRFADHWDLDNWNDHSAAWHERGIERAADTIAYVLDGVPAHPSDQLLQFVCSYTLLTGKRLSEDSSVQCTR
jgi:hypothetical protein